MDEKQKILIIDDNSQNIQVAANILKDDNTTIFATTSGSNGLEIAKLKQPNLILLDIQMPERDGFEICKLIKNEELTKHIPIVFMTAKTDEKSIESAYTAGGVDYITKPIRKAELLARVKTQLQLSQLIIALKKTSYTDGLTKLYNHNKIFELLDLEIIRAKRYKSTLSILMLDIDYFKKVNDEYGHQTGDVVLEQIAQEISKNIRTVDIAGRYGGEEFLVIFPGISKEEAFIVADRISKSIENLQLKENLKVTISGGIAEYKNEMLLNLIETADINLYKAKNKGRNRIEG